MCQTCVLGIFGWMEYGQFILHQGKTYLSFLRVIKSSIIYIHPSKKVIHSLRKVNGMVNAGSKDSL